MLKDVIVSGVSRQISFFVFLNVKNDDKWI